MVSNYRNIRGDERPYRIRKKLLEENCFCRDETPFLDYFRPDYTRVDTLATGLYEKVEKQSPLEPIPIQQAMRDAYK